MTRPILVAAVVLAAVALTDDARAAEPPVRHDAVAVIIGNRSYEERGHKVPDVDFAHNDAAAFARFAREVLRIPEHKILSYEDLTNTEMQRLFGSPEDPEGTLSKLVQLGNDDVYVFYSGHGVPQVRQDGPARSYLLPVDVPAATPQFGGYPLDRLVEHLEALPAERVMLVLDACFSGLAQGGQLLEGRSGSFGVAVAQPEPATQLTILAATAFDEPQYAFWLPQEEHGAFTYYLLRGLYGEADAAPYGEPDGRVELAEVRRYLNDRLSPAIVLDRGELQTPSLIGDDRMVLAALPEGDRPVSPFLNRRPGQAETDVAVGIFPGSRRSVGGTEPYQDLSRFRDCAECPEMVVIPEGSFWMGSPYGEEGRGDDEGPQHRRQITRFALGRTEVTFDEWQACVDDGGCRSNPRPDDEGWGRGSRPVINVSWNDVQQFVVWMNGKVEGEPYRLPTEAEWEYAARANTAGGRNEPRYHFGSMITRSQANFSNVSGTVRVDDLPAAENDWGLRHMHGNVWEWTEDCWHDNYRGAPSDGRPWLQEGIGNCARRVVRGGSWDSGPRILRSANRVRNIRGNRNGNFGFRLARTLTRFDGGSEPPFPFERVVGTFEEPWTAPAEPGARFREPLEGGGEGPEMVVIPAGSFWMGSPDGEAGRQSDEGPQHRRTIASFALGRTEVTVGEFRRFVEETGHQVSGGCFGELDGSFAQHEGWSWRDPGFEQSTDHPVACVSWEDAGAYVEWLNRKVEGSPYRLPTEAEWEYAARAKTSGSRNEPPYFWGTFSAYACGWANGLDLTAKQMFTGLTTVNCRDGYVYTAPVGSFRANGFDLSDMTGNLWEWTEDCWHENYRDAPGDQRAWLEENGGDCARRVVRGGSWNISPQLLRSAFRGRVVPGNRGYFIGFRLATTLLTP